MKALFITPLFALCFFLSLALNAQISTSEFEIKYEGETVRLTQDIDEQYLGTYLQNEGKRKRLYKLDKSGAESYMLAQTQENGKNFAWDASEKQTMEWGAMVKNGELVYMQVKEYEEGEMQTYRGIMIIYKDPQSGEYKDMLLYEVKGQMLLGGTAAKVSETVSN